MEQLAGAEQASVAHHQKIQLLVPIHNEGENVKTLYETLVRDEVRFDQLVFIYDLDTDTSLPFIETLSKENAHIRAEKNGYGRGVLNALKFGFSKAEPGPVIVVMGDNSDRLSLIPEMVSLWEAGATIVCPSRYMRGGAQYGGGILKSTMSRIAGISLKVLGFPTADATNNFKLYDGKWLKGQVIESRGGFEVALELCYRAFHEGKRILELPTVWTDRTKGKSNFKIVSWLPHYLKWYFKILKLLLIKRPST